MHELRLGEISAVWYGHASVGITDGRKTIYIDPHVLSPNPRQADIILVTHEHFDHANIENINKIRYEKTELFGPDGVIEKTGFGDAVEPSDKEDIDGIKILVVDAYNMNKFRSPGQPFHPKGLGVGYIVEINNIRIYHAGDTDNIPEMASLGPIDIAFLPVGGTYTMTLSEAAEAAKIIKPRFLVPMHFNSDKYGIGGINADPEKLAKMLAGQGIVVNVLEPLV